MLRLLAAIGAVGGCALAGVNASAKLRRRRDMLAELIRAVRRIAIGITHTNRPIEELLHGCGERETGMLFCALSGAAAQSVSPAAAWERLEAEGDSILDCLLERDRKALGQFFFALGVSGRGAQLENVEMTVTALEGLLAEAEAEYRAKGRVYRTMGVLMGMGVGILLL